MAGAALRVSHMNFRIHRSSNEYAVLCFVIGALPVIVISTYLADISPFPSLWIAIAGAVAGLVAMFAWSSVLKPLLGVALVGQCIAATAALTGHPWQLDSHMLFFAALAVLVVLRDIPTILAATVAIALHHVSLSVLFPVLVYPSADVLGGLMRTAFHAVIVLVEAGFLCLAIFRQGLLINQVEERAADVEAAATNEREAVAAREENTAHQRAAINSIAEALRAMSQGDLTARLNEPMGGNFENLWQDFNAAMTDFEKTIQHVIGKANGISISSQALANGSGDLARRTEQQAAALAETAETTTQIKEAVDTTVKMVEGADALVAKSMSLSEEGSARVAETVRAMENIEAGSKDISKIISTIDDIAFQTSLLALNAGVEAARAGEAGLGFAVVAGEVRALAQRAGEAAREITQLIRGSQNLVKDGVQLSLQARKSLNEITDQVSQVRTITSEITKATKTQSLGLNEITVSITELDSVTQHNAAMAEETTAASAELNTNIGELKALASKFSVSTGPGLDAPKAA